ncbi:MAG: L-serine ammonia-lyase [Moraxella sp.]|nr:L-serine ammonia-lyase [Moraxella sp.]
MIRIHEMFKIGIGPSSSHTVGPMVAANRFLGLLSDNIHQVRRVCVELYGSLASTGKGHATDTAILLGLLGHRPDSIDTHQTQNYLTPIYQTKTLCLNGVQSIDFDETVDMVWHMDASLNYHPNGMSLTAFFDDGRRLSQTYYSVGGGFVIAGDDLGLDVVQSACDDNPPYPFDSADDILKFCTRDTIAISQMMIHNECHYQDKNEIYQYLDDIWQVMQDCVKDGCRHDGVLPGGLHVKRRAKNLYDSLCTEYGQATHDNGLFAMDWVDLYALAVNEQNAGGGRVVTAPTNGAAGIIPAVLHYYRDFVPSATTAGVHQFLLTAGAVGALIKQKASISGAEVGCQGEVGSACAMAAAGLAEVLGGTPAQCLNAAEIGLEHNLGLTCDPIAGLVQVPCIERNAMAAVKAINAARLALRGNGVHHVSLDKAILTMKETGRDMMDKYKETARGGLAIHADNRITAVSVGVSVNFSQC